MNLKKKLEKKMEDVEDSLQYNEDDMSDIKRDNRKLENDLLQTGKPKFFGLPENSDSLDSSTGIEE